MRVRESGTRLKKDRTKQIIVWYINNKELTEKVNLKYSRYSRP